MSVVTAMQRQAAVTAYLKSKQLLLLAFARHGKESTPHITGWEVITSHESEPLQLHASHVYEGVTFHPQYIQR